MFTISDIFSQITHGIKKSNLTAPVPSRDKAQKTTAKVVSDAVASGTKFRRLAQRVSIKCEDCQSDMYASSTSGSGSVDKAYICDNCGRVEDIAIGNDIVGTQTYSGENAPADNKGRSESTYKRQQKKATVDQIENIVYQYKGPKLPRNVVHAAADLYYCIQQYYIKRGDVRKGTMAACLYRKCIENGITRKPKEIAEIFEIPQSELSNGEKVLDTLYAADCLRQSVNNQLYFNEQQQIDAFLARYYELFNIPAQYMDFSRRLIRFTEKYHLTDGSITSTKCAGSIYLLTYQKPAMGVTANKIAHGCRISKSTFNRFSQSIQTCLGATYDDSKKKVRSRLRQIFKKSGVPLPV